MRRAFIISGSIIAFAITFAGWMLVQQASRPKPVGPITQRWECVYTSDRDSYQRVIVYRDRNGDVMGHSAGAGRCRP